MHFQKEIIESRTTLIDLPGHSIHMKAPAGPKDSGTKLLFWWEITTAAVALSRHLDSLGDFLRGKRIVELGCGPGLVGIAAGILGGNVTFTDYSKEALELARMNALENGLNANATEFEQLDWEKPRDIGAFDVILGSEIVYDYWAHSDLARLMRNLLRPGGRILLADRKRLAVSRFIGRIVRSGYPCGETVITLDQALFPKQEISIFSLTENA
jgi:predicted nicotinamide N-methyase